MSSISQRKKTNVKYLMQGSVIAAMYVALVFIFNYWSFGFVQFRIAEALTVLPYFTSAAIPGLFIGCLISNILGGAVWADVVFGSLTTLLAAILSYLLRKKKYIVPLPPIILNMLSVPFILKFGYAATEAIPYMMITVSIGEIIACGVLGTVLLLTLGKIKDKIFR